MTSGSRSRLALRVTWALAVFALVAYAAQAAFAICGSSADAFFEIYVYNGLIAIAAGLCLTRAYHEERERAAWLAFGLGLAAWASGEAVYSIFYADQANPPLPSVSDVLWLALFPACYVGIVLLVRERVREFRASLWLDGLVGALAMASVGTALVMGAVADGGEVAIDLTYLFGDLLLLGFVVSALALTGWRPDRAWGVLGAGLIGSGAVDGFFLWQSATGAAVDTTLMATLWPASALLIAAAAWQQPSRRTLRAEGWRLLAMPAAFAITALSVLLLDLVAPVDPAALALAIACLLAVIVRMSVTLRENHNLLQGTRREALTDALTGLANRRRLMLDLEREVVDATTESPRVLMLFDLDGFKQYNDRFGHPVGDALLARLGRRLTESTGDEAMAYRLGGDEFCVLAALPEGPATELAAKAKLSLSDRGRGFEVGASSGMVMIPAEASDVSTALRLADQRLYAEKGVSKRRVAGQQTSKALMQVLKECEPELDGHLHEVAVLARRVGERLGLGRPELDELIRAAELHDVGKVAVPSSILRKRGPLDENEWGFVRQHTLVGDRILSAAPALSSVAHVVRASHERYDGTGYPDGLSGEEIPLAARIVAICDAFHAMTSERPYRASVAPWEALEELRRCSGAQFDPEVVAAFCALMDSVALQHAAA